MNNIRRIVIVDHVTHEAHIEDIDLDVLENEYDGDEQKYIDDNYTFEGDYSWDYVVSVDYIPPRKSCYDADPIEVDFKKMLKKVC